MVFSLLVLTTPKSNCPGVELLVPFEDAVAAVLSAGLGTIADESCPAGASADPKGDDGFVDEPDVFCVSAAESICTSVMWSIHLDR